MQKGIPCKILKKGKKTSSQSSPAGSVIAADPRPTAYDKSKAAVELLIARTSISRNEAMSVIGAIMQSTTLQQAVTPGTRAQRELEVTEHSSFASVTDRFKKLYPQAVAPDAASHFFGIVSYTYNLAKENNPEYNNAIASANDPGFFKKLKELKAAFGESFLEEVGALECFDHYLTHEATCLKMEPMASRISQVHFGAMIVATLIECIINSPHSVSSLTAVSKKAFLDITGTEQCQAAIMMGLDYPSMYYASSVIDPTTARDRVVKHSRSCIHMIADNESIPPPNVLSSYTIFACSMQVCETINSRGITSHNQVGKTGFVLELEDGTKEWREYVIFALDNSNPLSANPYLIGNIANYCYMALGIPACKTTIYNRPGKMIERSDAKKELERIGIMESPKKTKKNGKKTSGEEDTDDWAQSMKLEDEEAKAKENKNKNKAHEADLSLGSKKVPTLKSLHNANKLPMSNASAFDKPQFKAYLTSGLPEYVNYIQKSGQCTKDAGDTLVDISAFVQKEFPDVASFIQFDIPLATKQVIHERIENVSHNLVEKYGDDFCNNFSSAFCERMKLPFNPKLARAYLLRIVSAVTICSLQRSTVAIKFEGGVATVTRVPKTSTAPRVHSKDNRSRRNHSRGTYRGKR